MDNSTVRTKRTGWLLPLAITVPVLICGSGLLVFWISYPEAKPAPDSAINAMPAGAAVVEDSTVCHQDTDDHCERHFVVSRSGDTVTLVDELANAYCRLAPMERDDLGFRDTSGSLQWWGSAQADGNDFTVNVLRTNDLKNAEIILYTYDHQHDTKSGPAAPQNDCRPN